MQASRSQPTYSYQFNTGINVTACYVFLHPSALGPCKLSRYGNGAGLFGGVYESAPFIPSNHNASFPMVIQCPTPAVANDVSRLLQPLVNELYVHPPSVLLEELNKRNTWNEACDLLEQCTDAFFVLIRARRIGIYCGRSEAQNSLSTSPAQMWRQHFIFDNFRQAFNCMATQGNDSTGSIGGGQQILLSYDAFEPRPRTSPLTSPPPPSSPVPSSLTYSSTTGSVYPSSSPIRPTVSPKKEIRDSGLSSPTPPNTPSRSRTSKPHTTLSPKNPGTPLLRLSNSSNTPSYSRTGVSRSQPPSPLKQSQSSPPSPLKQSQSSPQINVTINVNPVIEISASGGHRDSSSASLPNTFPPPLQPGALPPRPLRIYPTRRVQVLASRILAGEGYNEDEIDAVKIAMFWFNEREGFVRQISGPVWPLDRCERAWDVFIFACSLESDDDDEEVSDRDEM